MKPHKQSVQTAQPTDKPSVTRPEIIASRKTCDATGTGLSHYVLMDQEPRR